MIVLDASAALSGLLNDGAARRAMSEHQLHVPHLADVEVASGLRRLESARQLTPESAGSALETWVALGLTRYAVDGLLGRVWALRANASAYDATYVALAEALGCDLVTTDARLAGAPGLQCPIRLVRR